MSYRLLGTCVCLIVAATPLAARAQGVDDNSVGESSDLPGRTPDGASFDPDKAVDPIRLVEGAGWKAGEDTVIHPVIGLETGMISNVFYTNNTNCTVAGDCVHSAAMIRALFQIGFGSLDAQRLTPENQQPEDPFAEQPRVAVPNPGAFQYRVDLRAAYDQMLSPDGTVNDTGGLSLGATGRMTVNPYGPLTLIALEDYQRLIRAADFETDVDTNRDINTLALRVPYHPHDHSLGGYLYYTNTIDVFERDSQQFADRMMNSIGLHPTYQWLPQTRIQGDVSQGFDTGIGSSSQKVTSYPTMFSVGIATLLTPLLSLNASAGYEWLNYTSGATTSGVHGGAGIGYRYSDLGRIYIQYVRQYADSINANYYDEDTIRAWAYQRFGRFTVSVQPEVHFRTYHGTIVTSTTGSTDRSDTIFSVIAGVSYNIKNSFQIGLDYRYTNLSTDFEYMTDGVTINPSYDRHALLLGVRAAL